MKLTTGIKLLWQKWFSRTESEWASYILADKICSWIYPKYKFSEYSRSWLADDEFFRYYERFHGKENYHSADRKFLLKNLLKLVDGLPGDTAECGVYQGASSFLICDHFRDKDKRHAVFDSFQGLSQPGQQDGTHWTTHQFTVDEHVVGDNLAEFPAVEIFPGWIPDAFHHVKDWQFCFVHIDVDLYQPTLDAARFFYERMIPGGILLCDDYGFDGCPGARRAIDEVLQDKPEQIVETPTGQAFCIKRAAQN
ncbi:MAG: TylF/MycF family methyltransferase [Pirellulaceae bacterium]|nr:TylF/MycF family methyltransferase [Pirellulaceae bacterium]